MAGREGKDVSAAVEKGKAAASCPLDGFCLIAPSDRFPLSLRFLHFLSQESAWGVQLLSSRASLCVQRARGPALLRGSWPAFCHPFVDKAHRGCGYTVTGSSSPGSADCQLLHFPHLDGLSCRRVLAAGVRAARALSTASQLWLGHPKGIVSPGLRNNADMCLALFLMGDVFISLRNYLSERVTFFFPGFLIYFCYLAVFCK